MKRWLHHNWPWNAFCCHASDCVMVIGRWPDDGSAHPVCPWPDKKWLTDEQVRSLKS